MTSLAAAWSAVSATSRPCAVTCVPVESEYRARACNAVTYALPVSCTCAADRIASVCCIATNALVVVREPSIWPTTTPVANSAIDAAMPPASHPAWKREVRCFSNPRVRSVATVRSSSRRPGSRSRGRSFAMASSLSSHSRSASCSSNDLLIPYLPGRLQQRAHVAARVKELALRCARRDPQALRNFVMAETLQVMQHEHRSVSIREQRERALEIDPLTHGRPRRLWLHLLRQLEHRPAVPPPQKLLRAVDPNARQPARKARLPLELRRALHRANPRLLNHILRVLLHSAQQPQQQLVEPWCMPTVKLAEATLIPIGDDRGDQVPVGSVGDVERLHLVHTRSLVAGIWLAEAERLGSGSGSGSGR